MQILSEINFGECKNSKTASFCKILGALNFAIGKFQSSKNAILAHLGALNCDSFNDFLNFYILQKSISRKISE